MIIGRPNKMGDWHILVVEDLPEDDDDRVRIYHRPDCGVRVTTGSASTIEFLCATQEQINNAGYYGMFDSNDNLKVGVWLIRPWVDKIVGSTWTEWDSGWHVEPLEPQLTEEKNQ